MPKECYHATKSHNDYMVLPNPHCLKHDDYLPPLDTRFGAQDYQLKQPEKTLAYAKALQSWAKKSPTTLAQLSAPAGGMCKGMMGINGAIDCIHR